MLFSLTACVEKTAKTEPTVSDQYGCLTVLGTSWGMSLDECLKVLDLKKEDVKTEDNGEGQLAFQIEKTVLGKKAKVVFIFNDGEINGKFVPIGLKKVSVVFEEQLELENAEEQVAKEHEARNIEFKKHSSNVLYPVGMLGESYKNKNTIASLDDDLRAKYDAYLIELGSNAALIEENKKDEILSSVTIKYDNDGKVYGVDYNGIEAAYINYVSEKSKDKNK